MLWRQGAHPHACLPACLPCPQVLTMEYAPGVKINRGELEAARQLPGSCRLAPPRAAACTAAPPLPPQPVPQLHRLMHLCTSCASPVPPPVPSYRSQGAGPHGRGPHAAGAARRRVLPAAAAQPRLLPRGWVASKQPPGRFRAAASSWNPAALRPQHAPARGWPSRGAGRRCQAGPPQQHMHRPPLPPTHPPQTPTRATSLWMRRAAGGSSITTLA